MNAFIPRLLGVIAGIAVTLPTPTNASAPLERYVVTASGTVDGTVYDTKTKLTWQQTVPSTTYYWADARAYCAGVSVGGTAGWRLPTMKELMTIVDFSRATAPLIDPIAFPGTPSGVYWSRSLWPGSSSLAWYVPFNSGYTASADFFNKEYVRCVR